MRGPDPQPKRNHGLPEPPLDGTDICHDVCEILGALGHPARLRIALRLRAGPADLDDLGAVSGTYGDRLGEHLDVLLRSGVVAPLPWHPGSYQAGGTARHAGLIHAICMYGAMLLEWREPLPPLGDGRPSSW